MWALFDVLACFIISENKHKSQSIYKDDSSIERYCLEKQEIVEPMYSNANQ